MPPALRHRTPARPRGAALLATAAVVLASTALAGCPSLPPPTEAPPSGGGALFGSEPAPGDDGEASARPFTEEEKAQSKGKLGGAWVSCYAGFQPSADPAGDLARLTMSCGRTLGLTATTPVRIGEPQAQADPSERFTFRTRAGRCYRVFAVGAPEVGDLDVAVLDPEGRLVAADLSRDRWPLVPPRGPMCLDREGVYTIEVSVAEGSGRYALQIWGD